MRTESKTSLFQRTRETNQISSHRALLRHPRERVDHSVFPNRDAVDVSGPVAVFKEDGTLVDISRVPDVVRDQMQILDSLRFSLRGAADAGHASPVLIDRAAGQVMQRVPVGAQSKSQVAITELVEHPAAARWLGGDPVQDIDALARGVEPEEIAGVAMHAV